jgi:hypothetical protein
VESWDKPLQARLEAAVVVSAACPTSPQLLVGPQRADVLTTGSTANFFVLLRDETRTSLHLDSAVFIDPPYSR